MLVLEDSDADYELLRRRLESDLGPVDARRVDSEASFAAALADPPDVIVADFLLPGFGAMRALDLRDVAGLDTPVVVVSGAIGEERAAAVIKHGAADYLSKDRLESLAAVVRGAVREQALVAAGRRAREQARLSAERFDLLVESVEEYAIFLVDAAGRPLTWGRGAERAFGYPAEEVLGTSPPGVLVAPDAADGEAVRLLGAAAARGRAEDEGERRRRDGSLFRANIVVRPRGSGGTQEDFLVVARDVTEQRELEQRLLRSQKMEAVGRLAGGVAHDFNNLLTVIAGSAELLADDLPPGDARRGDVEEIRRAAERGAALTRQLLAVSHRNPPADRAIDLRAVVDDMDSLLARVIGEHIEVSSHGPDVPLMVRADPTEVEQLLMNLAVNARDAMPEGGVLSIGLDVAEADGLAGDDGNHGARYARLRVGDTGVGIPDDVLRHLFEPFFTTKEPGRGSGLGLPTVHAIVVRHGGHIGVDTRVGFGTTFTIHLPLVEGAAPAADGGPGPAPPRPGGGHESILVVEDEPAVRRLVSRTLERAGYAVLVADSAASAAALWSRTPVDLLLTDIVMPGVNGPELARRFRAARPDARVVFMSGYAEGTLIDRAAHEAEGVFLQKPFTPDELAFRVRQVLDAAAGA